MQESQRLQRTGFSGHEHHLGKSSYIPEPHWMVITVTLMGLRGDCGIQQSLVRSRCSTHKTLPSPPPIVRIVENPSIPGRARPLLAQAVGSACSGGRGLQGGMELPEKGHPGQGALVWIPASGTEWCLTDNCERSDGGEGKKSPAGVSECSQTSPLCKLCTEECAEERVLFFPCFQIERS